MAQQNIVIGLELKDNGSFKISQKNAEALRKALEDGAKASVLLSKGISDPKKAEALQAQVALANKLTREINQANSQSKALSKAMASVQGVAGGVLVGATSPGLERGTAAANARGGSRDFARQAQGLGGLVHVYATFAANIWAVTAAYQGLSRAFETARLEESAKQLSATVGTSMKNLATDMQAASGYAVSFKESMQFAALGTQAGLSQDQLVGLTKAAKGAANVLGRDVNDAITRMIRGTAKMEQEILDELGIFVRAKDAYKEYAKANGLVGESALTQSERVKAYADAVDKASEKYKKFAEINDPFAQLTSTISNATTELLNFVNNAIVPVVQGLSDSKNLVESLILGGAAYLTKMAIPAVTQLKNMFFDTSKAQAAAAAANEQALLDLQHQREEMMAKSYAIPKDKMANISKKISNSLTNAIPSEKIQEKIQKAFINSVSAADFQAKMQKELEDTAKGKDLAATRYKSKAPELKAEADLIRQQSTYLSEVLAKDTEITKLLNGRVKSSADLLVIEEKINRVMNDRTLANTREQKAYDKQRTQKDFNLAAASLLNFGAEGTVADKAKELWSAYEKASKAAGRFGSVLVIVRWAMAALATTMSAFLGTLGWVLGAWLLLDLAVIPLAKKLGLITDSTEKVEASLESLGEQINTVSETYKNYTELLDDSNSTIEDRIKGNQAISQSFNSLNKEVSGYLESLVELNNMTGIDKAWDSLKDLFGYGIKDKQNENKEKLKGLVSQGLVDPEVLSILDTIEKNNKKMEKIRDSITTAAGRNRANFGVGELKGIYKERVDAGIKELKLTEDINIKNKERIDILIKQQQELFRIRQIYAEISAEILNGSKSIGDIFSKKSDEYVFNNSTLGSAASSIKVLGAKNDSADINILKKDNEELIQKLGVSAGKTNKELEELSTKGLTNAKEGLKEATSNFIFFKRALDGVNSPEALKFIEQYSDYLELLYKQIDALERKDFKAAEGFSAGISARREGLINSLIEADKQDKKNKENQSQREASQREATSERARVLEKIAKWESESQERLLDTYKSTQELNDVRLKGAMETQLFATRAQQQQTEADKQAILNQEKVVALSKLTAEYESDKAKIIKNKGSTAKLEEIYKSQRKTIEEQFNIRQEALDLENKIAETARLRLEYENTIYASQSRGIELARARLEAQKTSGKIGQDTFDNVSFGLDLAYIAKERAKVFADYGVDNEAQLYGNSKATKALEDLRQKETILRLTKEANDEEKRINRELDKSNIALSLAEKYLESMLDKSTSLNGLGLKYLNIEQAINKSYQQRVEKIKREEEDADLRALKILELQVEMLEKQEEIYQKRLDKKLMDFEAGKSALELQDVYDMAQRKADEFAKSTTNVIEGSFDAIYAGMDAAIDELTDKWMRGENISFKDIITTFRNTAAEAFRDLASEKMKEGFRNSVADIFKSFGVTTKEDRQKKYSEDMLKYTEEQTEYLRILAEKANPEATAAIKQTEKDPIEQIKETVMTKAKTALTGVFDWMKEKFQSIFGQGGLLEGAFKWLSSNIQTIFANIMASMSSSSSGGGFLGGLLSIGSSLLDGLLDGLFDGSSVGSSAGSSAGSSVSAYTDTANAIGGAQAISETYMLAPKFANGGIMTEYGPLRLNKYSKGGIADSPQLALYGEGRKNEAYVPLPDNRSIPVTMTGGGGDTYINVSVTDNSTTSSFSGGETNGDKQKANKEFAQIIAQKVREELVQQKRPGGLLYA
jgi:hypothetical protein